MVQRGRFEAKTMLCVWWNFAGSVYWELVPQGRTVDGTLYAEQLQRVYDIVRLRYPALVNRKRLLLQFDNGLCHKSRRVRQKIAAMDGVEILPLPPSIVPTLPHLIFICFVPWHTFCRADNSIPWMMCTLALLSSLLQSLQPGIVRTLSLVERWIRTIQCDGMYFAE